MVPHDPFDGEDTGPISTAMLTEARDAGNADRFLEQVAAKMADKITTNKPCLEGRGKKTLGLHTGEWVKIIIGYSVAGIIGLGAWYLAVNDGLKERPTMIQTKEIVQEYDRHHSEHPHPVTRIRLEAVEGEVKTIRQSQIRQEEQSKAQMDTLQGIKRDVEYLRRELR